MIPGTPHKKAKSASISTVRQASDGPANSELPTAIDLPDADLLYFRYLFPKSDADRLFLALQQEIHWQQEKITLYGKTHDVPRLTAWYGDPSKTYTYSGITVESRPWTPILMEIKREIEAVSNTTFNSVLLNRYRAGSDGVSWHADDEPELGTNPTIGSVSFGQSRPFQMKHRFDHKVRKSVDLDHGSCLLMKGRTQHYWLHQVPKTRRAVGERINLTFRVVS